MIAVLASMSVLRSFDQVFVMGNSNIFPKVRTLLYLIYQDGILNFKNRGCPQQPPRSSCL